MVWTNFEEKEKMHFDSFNAATNFLKSSFVPGKRDLETILQNCFCSKSTGNLANLLVKWELTYHLVQDFCHLPKTIELARDIGNNHPNVTMMVKICQRQIWCVPLMKY